MVTGMVLTAIPPIDRSIDTRTAIDRPMLMPAIAHARGVGVAGVDGAGGGSRMRCRPAI